MLKIAVVDDEHTVAAQTERCLTEACNELQLKAEINVFDSGEEVIRFLESKNVYHIIFLDIEMERCNGIDVSRYIRDMLQDETTQLVYVSGKNGYDRQLFEFRPFGFIEKPATTEKIREIWDGSAYLLLRQKMTITGRGFKT
ncbi:MAG: response regulator [Lachnospiraceae bacterium]|nr:response regulator [Lachnospiraceae bacterium]